MTNFWETFSCQREKFLNQTFSCKKTKSQDVFRFTIRILSFGTDRSEQIVYQTAPLFAVMSTFLDALLYEKPHFSNFRRITAVISGVRNYCIALISTESTMMRREPEPS